MPNHVIVSTLNWSENSLEKAVASVAALDFGQIDLGLHEGRAHLNPSDLAAGGASRVAREADRVREMLARRSMKRVSALDVDLAGDAAIDLAEQRRRLGAACDLARALDVDVMTLATAPWGSALVQEAERLRQLLPVARDRGVTLTVQTPAAQVTAAVDAVLRLCELVPGLGVTLDAAHLLAGPNRGADFSAVYPLVKLVHLRDATLEHPQVPAGTGQVDFARIVGRLHQLKYSGKFVIAYSDHVPTTVLGEGSTDVSENVTRMRDVFVAAERGQGIVRTP
ncbi:MAG TPA: sugar phosphate isomerase/epimerase [Chloroflexota bacterium]|nr:sugar phosphate isomerase/epimerase [Chloroflexota bacterium]